MTSTIKSKLQASGHQNSTVTLRKTVSSLAQTASVGKSLHLLSAKTKKLLKKLLLKISKLEQDIELKRQYLSANDQMEPYSLF